MIDTTQIFNSEKNPLIGGIDINNLISILSMTTKGGAYATLVSPDIIWFPLITNLNSLNGRPIGSGSGIDISGFLYAVADVKLSEIGRCIIKPWFWNEHAGDWFAGTSVSIFENQRVKTPIDGAKKFYIEVVEFYQSGDNPKISATVAGTSI